MQLLNWLVDLDEILFGGDGIEYCLLLISRLINSSQNFLFGFMFNDVTSEYGLDVALQSSVILKSRDLLG
jgi:hypothetical protein